MREESTAGRCGVLSLRCSFEQTETTKDVRDNQHTTTPEVPTRKRSDHNVVHGSLVLSTVVYRV